MQVNCTLITKTQVDWQVFLRSSLEYLRFSITAEMDRARIKCDSLESYIIALGTFAGYDPLDPRGIVRDFSAVLNHIHIGFMVQLSTPALFVFVTHSGKRLWSTLSDGSVCILSGGLYDWKQAIEDALHKNQYPEIITLCNKIIQIIDGQGLGAIWSDKKRTRNGDSFLLERK